MPNGISGVGPAAPPPSTPEPPPGIADKVKAFFKYNSSTLPKSPEEIRAPKPKVPILLRLGISVFGAGLFISPLGLGTFVVGAALFGLASTNTAGRFFDKIIVKPLNIAIKRCFEPSVEKLKKMDIDQLNATLPLLSQSKIRLLASDIQWLNNTIPELRASSRSIVVKELDLDNIALLDSKALNRILPDLSDESLLKLDRVLNEATIQKLDFASLKCFHKIPSLTGKYRKIVDQKSNQKACNAPGEFIRDVENKPNMFKTITNSAGVSVKVPEQFEKDVPRALILQVNDTVYKDNPKDLVKIYKKLVEQCQSATGTNADLAAQRIACVINQGFFADISHRLNILNEGYLATGSGQIWQVKITDKEVIFTLKIAFKMLNMDNPEISLPNDTIIQRQVTIAMTSLLGNKLDPLPGVRVRDIYYEQEASGAPLNTIIETLPKNVTKTRPLFSL